MHNCLFVVDKFALIGFMRKKKKVNARKRLCIRENTWKNSHKNKKIEY